MFNIQTADEIVKVENPSKLFNVAPVIETLSKYSPNTFKLSDYDAATIRTWLDIFVHEKIVIVDRQTMVDLAKLTEYLGANAYVLYDKTRKRSRNMEDFVELAVLYGGAHAREVIRNINSVNAELLARIGVEEFIKILEEGRRDLVALSPISGISSVARDYILSADTSIASRVKLMTWRPKILSISDATRVRKQMIKDAIAVNFNKSVRHYIVLFLTSFVS